MLSRVAECMFWMSRYCERAENIARLLDVNFHGALDLNLSEAQAEHYWEPLVNIAGGADLFFKHYPAYTGENVCDFLIFNRENPNSILTCLTNARENARSIVEQISSEMWEQINKLYHFTRDSRSDQVLGREAYSFYSEIKTGSHLFQGITDATMTHGEGWQFIQVGKFLERAGQTARIIDVKYHLLQPHAHVVPESYSGNGAHSVYQADPDPVDVLHWMAVLKSCSALEAYRKIYVAQVEPVKVVEFMLLHQQFPRSINFSITAVSDALDAISNTPPEVCANQAERVVGRLRSELTYTGISEILSIGLHDYLEDFLRKLDQVGEEIHKTYFAYRLMPVPAQEGVRSLPDFRVQQQQQQQ